jgi:malonyl-CoA decarboxylase
MIHSLDDGSSRAEVLSEMLQSLQARHDEDLYDRMKDSMLRWCAQYLTNTSSMDPVTRFHVENGASIYQIHYGADLSANGRERSFGLMVTYMYQGAESVPNSYRRDGVIPMHENVKQLIT